MVQRRIDLVVHERRAKRPRCAAAAGRRHDAAEVAVRALPRVGTIVSFVSGTMSFFVYCMPPKKNSLSLMIGPPMRAADLVAVQPVVSPEAAVFRALEVRGSS